MKKFIFAFISIMCMFACGTNTSNTVNDSTQVDTVFVDSIAVDSLN